MFGKRKTPEEAYAAFKKRRRIAAWVIIIVLVALYLSTLVFALIGTETSRTLLKFSILSTFLLPVMIYGYLLIYKVLAGNGVTEPPTEENESSKSN